MAGEIALAERDYPAAVRELRAADKWGCPVCLLPEIARAYDLSGNTDSALVVFRQFADKLYTAYPNSDMSATGQFTGGVYKRLGELYEAKGDRENAARFYSKFVDLWKNADPELQPKVAEVRKRLARLSDTEGKR